MARRPPSPKQLQAAVDTFNSRNPVGTQGHLRKDGGDNFPTHVKEPAYVLSGHSAVAFFEGVRGCYLIDRFTPMTSAPTAATEDA